MGVRFLDCSPRMSALRRRHLFVSTHRLAPISSDLELLQLTEFIQAEIRVRHGDELQELLLGCEDAYDAASQFPF